jgi:hypothetical protein
MMVPEMKISTKRQQAMHSNHRFSPPGESKKNNQPTNRSATMTDTGTFGSGPYSPVPDQKQSLI